MPSYFRALVGLKLTLLGLFLLVQYGKINIGELSLFAEETKANDEMRAPEENQPKDQEIHQLLEIPKISDDSPQSKETLGRYLDFADRKRQEIIKRLEFLEKRETFVKSLEQKIDKKLQQLDDERKFFAASIQKEQDLKKDRLDRLIELYDKMEPKKAASLFENLDPDLAVAMLKSLKQKQLTAILEKMTPDKATKLSEYFSRNKSGTEYEMLKEMNASLKETFNECKTPKELTEKN